MGYFDTFWSNTLAATGVQRTFHPEDPEALLKGRAYLRVYAGGTWSYSFLFSNTVDSTYADGSDTTANHVPGPWTLAEALVGVAGAVGEEPCWQPLTFGGGPSKAVAPGEVFSTDPVTLTAEKGQYLVLQLAYRGAEIPYLEENIIPLFTESADGFVPGNRMPLPAMAGCSRPVRLRAAFLGDSITEGIGTEFGAYRHWNAMIAEGLREAYGWWNLGIGYGRAADAAMDGAWLAKAKAADLVNVCYGVNDLYQKHDGEALKRDLAFIVEKLTEAGCTVGLFTVPPFDYPPELEPLWREVNRFIAEELGPKVRYVYDTRPFWGKEPPLDHMSAHGAHPDETGCALLAEDFCARMKGVFESACQKNEFSV